MSLRVFGSVRAPRRSAPPARDTDDLAWFTDAAADGGIELDADPPRLEWRAPAAAECIRWHPPVPPSS